MAKTTKDKRTTQSKRPCFCCGKEYVDTSFYKSHSKFFESTGKLPYCKQCIERLYQHYYERYVNDGCLTPEINSIKRLCMIFDIYYSEKAFIDAMEDVKRRNLNISSMGAYMKMIQLSQYKGKTYDNTIIDEELADLSDKAPISYFNDINIDDKIIMFWGTGFTEEDYKFLQREYNDWVARHECKTKAQEEVFKRLCFKQLEILKATRRGEDTKDLDYTFQKLLDTAKLQPKQNSGDAMADNQTFGTLIDKWENERPLPDIDEELKDVDKIGLYLDVFFKGHLAKMMGLKNGFSRLYSEYMKKYTVEKPEYESDEDSEALFDAIFGSSLDKDEEVV